MKIYLGTSFFWFPIALFIAILLAYFTYFGFQRPNKKLLKWPDSFLFLLRTLGIFLITLLLLSPFLKYKNKVILKPKLAILLDNSISLNNPRNLDFYKSINQKLKTKFPQFDIEYNSLTQNSISIDSVFFNQKHTNLTKGIQALNVLKSEQLQALLIVSDGIINEGVNPNYYPFPLKAPIYTIGLGDTSALIDAKISEAKSNEFVLLGNSYPLVFNLIADQFKGKNLQYSVLLNGVAIHNGSVVANDDKFFFSKQIMLEAKTPGIQRISVKVNALPEEKNKANNTYELYVNVLDNRKKIAIYHQGVHPDIKALNLALSAQKNYEVSITNNIAEAIKKDVIIAVQVPNLNGNKADALTLFQSKKPLLLVGGEMQDWNAWKDQIGLLQIKSNRPNNAQFQINELFSGFNTSKEEADVLAILPPLTVPFGNFPNQLKPIAIQKINGVVTNYPLIATVENQQKMAVFFGEGLWQWYQGEYRIESNHQALENLLDHMVQWLLSGKDKPLFSVNSSKPIYDQLEEVQLKAELYSQIFELINNEKVTAIVKGDSFSKEIVFGNAGNIYEASLGNLPAGNYSVLAKAKGLTAQTGFSVGETIKEQRILQADWALLRNLASNHQGSFYNAKDFDLLLNELNSKLNKTAITKTEEEIKDLINIPWFLLLAALIFAFEWMTRKYYGKL